MINNSSDDVNVRSQSHDELSKLKVREQKTLMDDSYKRITHALFEDSSVYKNRDLFYQFISEVVATFAIIEGDINYNSADYKSLKDLKDLATSPYKINELKQSEEDYRAAFDKICDCYFIINKLLARMGISSIGVPNVRWIDAT